MFLLGRLISLIRNHVEEVINECLKNKITSVDILGFEYEMGLFPTIQEEAKSKVWSCHKQFMEVLTKPITKVKSFSTMLL